MNSAGTSRVSSCAVVIRATADWTRLRSIMFYSWLCMQFSSSQGTIACSVCFQPLPSQKILKLWAQSGSVQTTMEFPTASRLSPSPLQYSFLLASVRISLTLNERVLRILDMATSFLVCHIAILYHSTVTMSMYFMVCGWSLYF